MSSRTKLVLACVAVFAVLAAIASQTQPVQRLYYALNYERTLDRYSQSDTTAADITVTVDGEGRAASLLSAFFGMDDALPGLVGDWAICEGAGNADGMPVIFSHEVDLSTLDPGDFTIVQASGAAGSVTCLTLAPADDVGELRTVLLAGQFGSPDDPPVTVEVTGHVHSIDGAITFKGAKVPVTPLESGPSLVLAEVVPEARWAIGAEPTGIPFGGGNGCPAGTQQIIRVTWEGGITKPGGAPADEAEGQAYRLLLESGVEIAPMALADTGDGDNNHKLCLDTDETIVSVSFPAGLVTDPREDLNPATQITVSGPSDEADTAELGA